MAITPAGVAPPVVSSQPTTTAAAPAPQPAPQPAPINGTPPNQGSAFANAGPGAQVAGVAGNVPAAPPAPAVGESFAPAGGVAGKIYDAQALLKERLNLSPGGELRLFHHSKSVWGTPGEKTWISPNKSDGGLGKGFYTSTIPETGYGPNEFQLALPVSAFAGKKIFEVNSGGTIVMPPGVDVLAFRLNDWTNEFWLVFKPDSADWLNQSVTIADFDKPGEVVGWS